MKKFLKVCAYVLLGLFALGVATSIVGGNDTPKDTPKEPKKEVVQHEKPKTETKKDDSKSQAELEVSYYSELSDLNMDLANILYDFSDVMTEGTDPNVFVTSEYHAKVQEVCDRMNAKIMEIMDMDVPDSAIPFHNKLVDALEDYQFVADNTPEAIKNNDVDLLNKVLERMTDGTAKIEKLTDEMDSY